jgi:hypothetical protein
MTLQVQVTAVKMEMGMEMVMARVLGTVKTDQPEMEMMEEIPMIIMEEHLMGAAHSLIDVNDRENFLLDIISDDCL